MITKYVEYDIICDICGVDGCLTGAQAWRSQSHWYKWDYLLPYSENGIRDMRKIAQEHGWLCKRRKDICPSCQEQLEGK